MSYLTQIDTSTLMNQNIVTALLVHTFTNTARVRKIWIDVFCDQVAGNGDYIAHITRQKAGAGSFYESIKTTKAVASGVTSIMFNSIPLIANVGDVIRVYVIGLAGDTTTPDIITEVNEEWANIDASGRVDVGAVAGTAQTARDLGATLGAAGAGLTAIPNSAGVTTMVADYARRTGDYATVAAVSAIATILAGITSLAQWLGLLAGKQVGNTTARTELRATGAGAGTFDETTDSVEAIRDRGDAAWVTAGGSGGALTLTYTLTSSVDASPIQGATVELYANVEMTGTPIATQTTNALGVVTFSDLIAGTYYLKRIKSGWTFTNPDQETVSA